MNVLIAIENVFYTFFFEINNSADGDEIAAADAASTDDDDAVDNVADFSQLLNDIKEQKMQQFNRWQRRLFRLALEKCEETADKPIISMLELPKQYVAINDFTIRDGHMFAGGYNFQTDRVNSMGYLEKEGQENEPIVQQKWIGICEKCKAGRQITTQFLLNTGELYFDEFKLSIKSRKMFAF